MGFLDFLEGLKDIAVDFVSEVVAESSKNSKNNSSSRNVGNDRFEKIRQLDKKWIRIGKLERANLTPYNSCVGLYKHVINGKVMYIGRAIELYNGGFRKRLSDYCRNSDSARKHKSGRIIHENLDKIVTYILIVGDTEEAIEETKRLEGEFIRYYGIPKWNVQINI